ncbi:MAG TPA: NAD(P)/FAD-dependent oxidoreductase [Solirubrobacteraceae bacterium]|jgi:cation diffusion facilitator CzcD-associated flavoprotein CzcO|nr:NAD(P)/FAD-dependent oxidoreductase [Solirubrobacteraceae bacterium]
MSAATVAMQPRADSGRSLEVVVIGAGLGGVAAAIELRRHGITKVTVLERAPDLGGTWFYNSYPGAACDVPSHLYSYSYAKRRDWSHLCSPQAEIHDYIRGVARSHQVDGLVRPNRTVTDCSWSEESCRWTVETAERETYEADAIVLATGQLHQPAVPRIEGADTFAGHSFHSARWDHGYPLAGRRVAVVGTGASAVQFVPEIAAKVGRLTVFQRTGNWFLPRKNRRYPAIVKEAIRRLPGVQEFRRKFMFQYCEAITLAIRHPRTVGRLAGARSAAFMRSQLKDPETRTRAWPDYTFGCKRVLFSSYFLPALQRPNVELVTDAITRIVPEGIVTADGAVHEADCIIWATGFHTTEFMFPMSVTGRDATRLNEYWSGGAHAHLGMTVPGFPNMFIMYGPNTNTSGGSIIFYLETQAAYIRQALQQLINRRMGAIEVRPEIEAASDRALQARFAGTAWTGCDSWYRDEQGRIVANWPGYMREYLEQASELSVGDFSFQALPDRTPIQASVAQEGSSVDA